jgi:hypothetical protein
MAVLEPLTNINIDWSSEQFDMLMSLEQTGVEGAPPTCNQNIV